MKARSVITAFNARFLTPSEVAQSFIPTPQFDKLRQTGHSILMGPRGCGKTTLLKMLTDDALDTWERLYPDSSSIRPGYSSVYIPSDSRWSVELKAIGRNDDIGQLEIERIQRVLVSITVIREWINTIKREFAEKPDAQVDVSTRFIRAWRLQDTIPSAIDIRNTLDSLASTIRAIVARGATDQLSAFFDSVSPNLDGNILDACIACCNEYEATCEALDISPHEKWALCFDELEISPEWLHRELIGSIRSTDQRFYLKLTWSPVLPEHRGSNPQGDEDFDTIRLWYSHVDDAREFCTELTSKFLNRRNVQETPDVKDFFGSSLFSREIDDNDTYDRGSDFYLATVELARDDSSLAELLKRHGVDPGDPVTDDIQIRNTLLRKIKPFVLLRDTFTKEVLRGEARQMRSRKRPALYSGEELIYSMSEGNPRRLMNLLNDLVDFGYRPSKNDRPFVPRAQQARILSGASNQFLMYIKTIPTGLVGKEPVSLHKFVSTLGEFFASKIYEDEFPVDPPGSFTVAEDTDEHIVKAVEAGVDVGAFIFIGKSQQEVIKGIRGSRFRLTFLLSPAFKLSLRNLKAKAIEACLEKSHDPKQTSMFDGES